MKNKTSKNNAVTAFTLIERPGGLPFIDAAKNGEVK